MDNKSILGQIINNYKTKEIKLNAVMTVNNLFNELNGRERDVLTRRFGLRGQDGETLEKVGKIHKLTRERVRQIENSSIERLKKLKNLESLISGFKKAVSQLLEEHGGLMEREYLLNNLVHFSVDGIKCKSEDKTIYKSHLNFLISRLLRNEFEEVNDSKNFKKSLKLKHQTLDYLEILAEELIAKIEQDKRIFMTEELIDLIKELNSFKNNQDQFNAPNNINIADILNSDFSQENTGLINNNKILWTVLQAARNLSQNKFGYWGIYSWREINPKTINDKIYLVLKNHGKPIHFTEIADRINQISFDRKIANAATVHNELILDDKYVLVGRGLYGLKELGYLQGTVADVIENFLINTEELLSYKKIVNKVLEQRLVKEATIHLALMDKDRFEKVEGGKYKIASNLP
ncbi:MAG: sigma factor-like helix-turn-helix DNA-binding protein [Patescibacteria group bacterium]|nr:sigma factor-like helix-turn-helix DNA-binding protein [Patescibacteria group bacterium]